MDYDIIIVGTGVAGLYSALKLGCDKRILMITKSTCEESDSYLAQGGICVLKDETDYGSFFEDTLKAGHYENRHESVKIMIKSSRDVINDLIGYGVRFEKENGEYVYTKEGAHSTNRILYHKDITGKEITSKLLEAVRKKDNVTIMENTCVVDLLTKDNICYGVVILDKDDCLKKLYADYTVLATGGIGGLYKHSTNYPHLTADALAFALKHGIELENVNYVQIHPTTLYSEKKGRRFLISESVRGEGALLYDKNMQRFADELLPRDLLTKEIYKQMEKDNMPYVWLSMKPLGEELIMDHFPNIYARCLEEGYDVTKECIPVVPAQHYFMGGVRVDSNSKTSMDRLYSAGETSCNGVHGKNRLASNSLLESLVFAKRLAKDINNNYTPIEKVDIQINDGDYTDCASTYRQMVLDEIERQDKSNG